MESLIRDCADITWLRLTYDEDLYQFLWLSSHYVAAMSSGLRLAQQNEPACCIPWQLRSLNLPTTVAQAPGVQRHRLRWHVLHHDGLQ